MRGSALDEHERQLLSSAAHGDAGDGGESMAISMGTGKPYRGNYTWLIRVGYLVFKPARFPQS